MLRKLKRNFRVMALFSYLDDLKAGGYIDGFIITTTSQSITVLVDLIVYGEPVEYRNFVNQLHGILPGMVCDMGNKFYWTWS